MGRHRGAVRRRGGLDPSCLDPIRLVALTRHRAFELADPLAERVPEVGQLFRAEDDERHDQDKDDLQWSYVGHHLCCSLSSFGVPLPAYLRKPVPSTALR